MRRLPVHRLCALGALVVGCAVTSTAQVVTTPPSPTAADVASPATASAAKPFAASGRMTMTRIDWAGANPTDTSTFDGRCSVPSTYVITFSAEADATDLGRVTGEFSHCSQLTFGPNGPTGATYRDGRGKYVAANGDELLVSYTDGVSGATAETGMLWWRDKYTVTGGTGRFAGASGAGQDHGEFANFEQVLKGESVPFNAEGTLSYGPDR
jgi:hypothetical protein